MPKRAYVVVGPESSGNRLLSALLVRAGCKGLAGQNAPDELPMTDDPALVLRSYPHGWEWPDLRSIVQTLRDRGYLVRVLVTVRDHYCTIQSQVNQRLHTPEVAEANTSRALTDIFKQIASVSVGFCVVPYESIVLHKTEAIKRLLEWCDLPLDNLGGEIVIDGLATTQIKDANAKYLA